MRWPLLALMWGVAVGSLHGVELARNGRALVPVVVPEGASQQTRTLAYDVAAGLEKITGASFEITTAREPQGIAVGTDAEWPGLLEIALDGRSERLGREDYRLKDTGAALLMVGRTHCGLENAVWDFFHRLGFRHYLPGEHWEIWPQQQALTFEGDFAERPDYYTRRIFIGGGEWNAPSRAALKRWRRHQRMAWDFQLETQHIYGDLIRRHAAHFAAYPEDATPEGKLDPSRASTLEVAVREAQRQLTAQPERDSVSMEPSDGGGWRKDSPLGSPSDQAVTLANHVAAALREAHPGVKVGIYAYNEHSPAPSIAVDPDVVVSIATHFRVGGQLPEELMRSWAAKGARELGIREYISIWPWERDLPGRSLATDPERLTRGIAQYHELGARYWIAEATSAWLPNGVGNWLAARVLWDVKEAEQWSAMLEEYYSIAFGKASSEMRRFHEVYLLASGRPLLSEDLLGRMYRTLDQALALAEGDAQRQRILDFVAYTRYCDLYFAYQNASDEGRQAAYEALARYSWSVRDWDVTHVRALLNLPKRDSRLKMLADWRAPAGDHPLKSEEPPQAEVLVAIMKQRIAETKLNDFEPKAFSADLVPLEGPAKVAGAMSRGVALRGVNSFYLYLPEVAGSVELEITGGLLYGSRGPVRLRLFSPMNPIVDEPVATAEVPPDRAAHRVELTSPYRGLHRVEVDDGNDKTQVSWPSGLPVSFPAGAAEATRFEGSYDAAFYVPKGTKVLGGYTDHPGGALLGPGGSVAFNFKGEPAFFSIPVPAGQDGKVWRLRGVRGQKLLLTVPPYLAPGGAALLISQEVKP